MKIISGGQTGADRGGTDGAIAAGADWGGWVPRFRKAEDGKVPASYDRYQEHPVAEYQRRTWANVNDSDATVIFARQPLAGGSKLTARYCRQLEKPFVIIHPLDDPFVSVTLIRNWIEDVEVTVNTLNVAGHRESRCPGLQAWVKDVIQKVLEMP
jgi:hypothetical protein